MVEEEEDSVETATAGRRAGGEADWGSSAGRGAAPRSRSVSRWRTGRGDGGEGDVDGGIDGRGGTVETDGFAESRSSRAGLD